MVGREPTVERIRDGGIQLTSALLGEFTARPAATAELGDAVDVLFVAAKATGLDAALSRIRSEPALVVPLLNGLDHMQRLRERFATVAAGDDPDRIRPPRARRRSCRPAPGCASSWRPTTRACARRSSTWRARSSAAGVPALVGPGEAQILWSKLVRLTALACTTSASDQPIGFIRDRSRVAPDARGMRAGGGSGGQCRRRPARPAGPLRELEAAHAELGSSMRRDIAAGREPELDAIAGSVLRAGRRHGIELPDDRAAQRRDRRARGDPAAELLERRLDLRRGTGPGASRARRSPRRRSPRRPLPPPRRRLRRGRRRRGCGTGPSCRRRPAGRFPGSSSSPSSRPRRSMSK